MTDFTIDDMINSALESKPETFKDAFSSIMTAKLADAVELKKQEIAQSMYSDSVEEPEEEQETIDYEEVDDGETAEDYPEERD